MSKRNRSRQKRLMEVRRREQAALARDINQGEDTDKSIGDAVRRLNLHKMNSTSTSPMDNLKPVIHNLSELPNVPAVWPKEWPACPASCDINEWSRALENHDYYNLCVTKDKDAKPWFQYPRVAYQYSEFVYITPEMAQQLLEYNPLNRKMKLIHVEGLKRDIQNHRWLQTHESIAINKLGNMHDGQHRAVAIIKAETGWPLYVTWNVPPEGVYATDSGDKRPINEKLGFLFPDLKMTHKTAALCRSMMWGLQNRGVRYTESEIAAFMFKHKRLVNWTMHSIRAYRSDLQAVIGKAMLWWGEEVIGLFVERLRTVQFVGEGDPAKALYLWLQNAKQQGRRTSYVSPIIYYKKALAAIHAHAAGRDAKRITAKERDIFEWLPGWDVPQDAPSNGEIFIHADEGVTTEV